jgi:hypothetical protein
MDGRHSIVSCHSFLWNYGVIQRIIWKQKKKISIIHPYITSLWKRSSMARCQCDSPCDRGSYATLVSHGMGDQCIIELLRVSKGTVSRWSWVHLQLLAPTNPHWARVVGYGPFSLCVIHKEGLCPSRDINRLMMITLRPFPFGIGRDHFLPLAIVLTHTVRFYILYLHICIN